MRKPSFTGGENHRGHLAAWRGRGTRAPLGLSALPNVLPRFRLSRDRAGAPGRPRGCARRPRPRLTGAAQDGDIGTGAMDADPAPPGRDQPGARPRGKGHSARGRGARAPRPRRSGLLATATTTAISAVDYSFSFLALGQMTNYSSSGRRPRPITRTETSRSRSPSSSTRKIRCQRPSWRHPSTRFTHSLVLNSSERA